MAMVSSLMQIGAGLPSGFLFGTGYGAGVRFGYEDVYPYLKGNMGQIANLLNIPYASSGFKLASGVTERQGMLSDAQALMDRNQGGLRSAEQTQGAVNPNGSATSTAVWGDSQPLPIYDSKYAVNPYNGPFRYAEINQDMSRSKGWVIADIYEKKGDRYHYIGRRSYHGVAYDHKTNWSK